MAPTSDERREVAERLRGLDVEITSYDTLERAVDKFMKAVCGERPFSPIRYSVRNLCGLGHVLADLIYPTCHKVIPSEIEGYVFCSKCGAEIGEYGVPNYCHNCGARVATDMTPTDDERREVAERIREDASCSENSPRFVIESYLGIEYDGTDVLEESYESESLLRLADLIDPTCEMKDAGDVPASVKDNLNAFFCSECGSPVYNDMSPSYCPYCGARVTSGGEG